MRRSLCILAGLLFLALSAPIAAQENPAIRRQAEEVYGYVMSPFCPGRLLRDCPSEAAGELKDRIALDLAAGLSKEKIMESLVARYGEEVRAMPANRGVGHLAWWLPGLFFVFGAWLIYLWLRSHKSSPGPAQISPLDPATQARIEKELNE